MAKVRSSSRRIAAAVSIANSWRCRYRGGVLVGDAMVWPFVGPESVGGSLSAGAGPADAEGDRERALH
jgi:hypothetical protein